MYRLGPPYHLLCSSHGRTGQDHLHWARHAATVSQPPRLIGVFSSFHLKASTDIPNSRTMQTVQSYMSPLTNAIRNPSSFASRSAQAAERSADSALNSPQSFLTRLRNLDSATLTTVGIVGAETLGFFSVGEIIGRFKLVGYRTSGSAHDYH